MSRIDESITECHRLLDKIGIEHSGYTRGGNGLHGRLLLLSEREAETRTVAKELKRKRDALREQLRAARAYTERFIAEYADELTPVFDISVFDLPKEISEEHNA